MKNISTIVTAAALGALLSACGGSGGGSTPQPPSSGTSHASATAQSATITINVPGRTPAGVRRATYVGAGTQSAVVTVTAGTGVTAPSTTTTTVNCTSTCQATVAAYPGSNTFAVNLYDGTNGSGNLLSAGSTTATIVAGSNAINLTFNGVPVAVAAVANPPFFSSGTPATTTLTVNALDADANTIVGPGTYTSAITLASGSPHVTLSPAMLNDPTQTSVTASYDGTAILCGSSSVLITGTIASVTGPAGLLAITSGVLCGLSLSVPVLNLTVPTTGTVTVTDPGYSGGYTIINDTCTGPGYATISPSVALGPLATYTITPVNPTAPASCTYGFSDGTNMTTLTVTISL